jgi:hypothetical protein
MTLTIMYDVCILEYSEIWSQFHVVQMTSLEGVWPYESEEAMRCARTSASKGGEFDDRNPL